VGKIAAPIPFPAAPSAPTITWGDTLPVLARINFQPATAALPAGYQKDDGSAYSAARGYGWDQGMTGGARDRDLNADQRLDTFIYVGAGSTATWQYTLPNGTYLVSLAAGDAGWAHAGHVIVVEGVTVINNLPTAVNNYITRTDVPVTVSDGQLSITLGGPGAGNTMMCYVEIRQ